MMSACQISGGAPRAQQHQYGSQLPGRKSALACRRAEVWQQLMGYFTFT